MKTFYNLILGMLRPEIGIMPLPGLKCLYYKENPWVRCVNFILNLPLFKGYKLYIEYDTLSNAPCDWQRLV